MKYKRNEAGQANGCLVFVLIVVGFLFVSCVVSVVQASNDNDEWCRETEAFWADGNQYDDGLDDEYALQC